MAKKAKSVSTFKLKDMLEPKQAQELELYKQFLKTWEAKSSLRLAHQAQVEAIQQTPGMSDFNPMAVHSRG